MSIKTNRKQHPQINTPRYVWDNPGKLIDRNGRSVITTSDVWLLNNVTEDLQINWNLVCTVPDVKDSLKAYVAHAIEAQSSSAAWTIFNHIKYVIQEELPTLSSTADLTYTYLLAALVKMRSSGSAWRFGHVRRWYRWCYNRRISGFDKEITQRLYRLKVPTNTTGEAVMTRDPARGPLDDQEHWLLRQAIKQGKGPLLDRACVMLPLELGLRPAQAVLLEEQDLKVIKTESGHEFFSLDVIRLKQRTVGTPAKKRRKISPELGHVLQLLIDESHRIYGDGGPETPILRSLTAKPISNGIEGLACEGDRRVRRMTRLVFTYRVRDYTHKVDIISPRTGSILNLFPYRLRYTFGTRHGNQGTPAAVLAVMLDHSNINSVRVYTNSSSNLAERLNHALGKNEQYTGILNLFLGEIIERTGDEAPHKIVHGTTPTFKNIGDIGACGANYLCKLFPPLSCYVCPKFQAWADGPHERLLVELEGHIRSLAERTSNASDRIPYQLVDAITAIRALLNRLEEDRRAKS